MSRSAEDKARQALNSKLREMAKSRTVSRFLAKFWNVRTKAVYAAELALHLRWLKSKGASKSPDELVRDNLECIFRPDAVDVETKRKHRPDYGVGKRAPGGKGLLLRQAAQRLPRS